MHGSGSFSRKVATEDEAGASDGRPRRAETNSRSALAAEAHGRGGQLGGREVVVCCHAACAGWRDDDDPVRRRFLAYPSGEGVPPGARGERGGLESGLGGAYWYCAVCGLVLFVKRQAAVGANQSRRRDAGSCLGLPSTRAGHQRCNGETGRRCRARLLFPEAEGKDDTGASFGSRVSLLDECPARVVYLLICVCFGGWVAVI